MVQGQHAYKDRLFSFIFGGGHREWTLSLYNAVNHTHYDNPDDISIETIRQVLYLGMYNDLAFIIADILSLYEQQSTFNPNMPVRMLEYVANLMEKHIRQSGKNKYGQKLIELPAPRLVVFYNGVQRQPDVQVLRLSDAFRPELRDSADISVTVHMYNINKGHNEKLLTDCKTLGEYAWIVDSVRTLRLSSDLETAIDQTIRQLPADFLTRPYLEEHQAEVKNMLLTEYNESETMEMFRREGKEEGRKEGIKEGRKEGRQEGRESERLLNIRNLMASLKLSARDAMNALQIPAKDQERYISQL